MQPFAEPAAHALTDLLLNELGVGRCQSVFEPFAQAEQAEQTLAHSRGGLGPGLALVKGFVELHGGHVEARSEDAGCGAEFVLWLPLAHAPPNPGCHDPAAAKKPQPRVLVVEDNDDAAQTLAELLRRLDHEVRVAGDVRSALALATQLRPDTMVCDLGLPDEPGHALSRRLRADPAFASTQLIALSG